MVKPKSLNQMWDEYVSERIEQGAETLGLPHSRLNNKTREKK